MGSAQIGRDQNGASLRVFKQKYRQTKSSLFFFEPNRELWLESNLVVWIEATRLLLLGKRHLTRTKLLTAVLQAWQMLLSKRQRTNYLFIPVLYSGTELGDLDMLVLYHCAIGSGTHREYFWPCRLSGIFAANDFNRKVVSTF